MKMRWVAVLCVALLSAVVVTGQSDRKRKSAPSPSPTPQLLSESETLKEVKWQKGPSIGQLGNTAKVQVPAGYVFAGGHDTRTIMEAFKNPTSGQELGFVAPDAEDWFAVFEFDDVGYVRDDEKSSLDADAILSSIKTATENTNKERLNRGWPTMTIIGWEQTPRYNETTHNLEWAVRADSEGKPVINYNTRVLGRLGVMEVTLVTDAAALQDTLPKFKTMLAGFEFSQGKRYAEFRAGDKIAEYGLTGLIVGGTTVALVKTGAFKYIWKLLVAAGLAISAFFKKLFSRKKVE